jgi:multidrug efflux pump subunit AcrA (membrane-fusion protein)
MIGAAPTLAQENPRNPSTPDEQSQTADLNREVSQSNQAIDAQAAANDAQYQAQQQQYQQQLQQNDVAQQQFNDQTAQYESLRDRYAAERRAYRRAVWPDRYRDWVVARDARLLGSRVEILNGDRVGTVEAIARTRAGHIEALRVGLDSGKTVWIDEADIRFNRQDRIVMTNLDRTDLRSMADHRL